MRNDLVMSDDIGVNPRAAFRIVVVNLPGRGVLADPDIHVGRSRQYERAAHRRREDLG
jgi:hypothetical protein